MSFKTFSVGEVLTASNTNTHLRQGPQVLLSKSVDQAVNTATDTSIAWEVGDVVEDTLWSSGANTLITATTSGLYLITYTLIIDVTNTSTTLRSWVEKNSSTKYAMWSGLGFTGSSAVSGSALIPLAAADTMRVRVNHSFGSARNVFFNNALGASRVQAIRLDD
jgi:hypothetical protein